MSSLDQTIAEALYDFSLSNNWFRILVVFFGHWSGYLIVPIFATWALWLWAKKKQWLPLAQGLLAALIARLIFVEPIRMLFPVDRPFIKFGVEPLFWPTELSSAFPSGHAAFYFALGISVLRYNKILGWLFITDAILMGLGRIASAVHWATDVLAGALVAALSVPLARFLAGRLARRLSR